ncbi:hypothetical protein ACFFYR_22970 [Paraburkholderia dipogonis]|uniref:hypothetical protein n=1 Tax=Paraburkholderia dipogonis TaxID=1211383 RepID=UPI0035ED871A
MRQKAFGELHMLSHLVGAANRADIRRLVALEEENAALKRKDRASASRFATNSACNATRSIAALNEQIAQLHGADNPARSSRRARLEAEAQRLRDKLARRRSRSSAQSRREAAEQRALQEQEAHSRLRRSHDQMLTLLKLVQTNATPSNARHWMQPTRRAQPGTHRASLDSVQANGSCTWAAGRLERRAQTAGGSRGRRTIVHRRRVEDRKGLLAAALPGADVVVFPVDCIAPYSMIRSSASASAIRSFITRCARRAWRASSN